MSDDFVQPFLDDPETKEALSWLKAGSETDFRNLGELDTVEESIAIVQCFYDAGAVEVLVVEIDIDEDYQNSGKLLVKLSDNPTKRDAVLGSIMCTPN